MRKLILVILLAAMSITPCFSQEIKPEGIFSIEGTLWGFCGFDFYAIEKIYFEVECPSDAFMGFYKGRVYHFTKHGECNVQGEYYYYIDFPFVSIVFRDITEERTPLAILQPIGFGIYSSFYVGIRMGIMFKVNDNWKPEVPIFDSIFPAQGEQGLLLTDVRITGIRTTFEDDGVFEIIFHPPYEVLTGSNIRVINDTEIAFDLHISVDAPIGLKGVVVRDDSGKTIIWADDVFEVLEKDN